MEWLVLDAPWTTSSFTEDNWEVYMDARVVQLYNSLRCKIFVNPLQLGFFTSIFCHNCLFIELMGQVAIFIKEHGASSSQHKRCCTLETSNSRQWMLVSFFGWLVRTTRARKRPKSFGFGATATHLQLQHIIFLGHRTASGYTVLLYQMRWTFRVLKLKWGLVCSQVRNVLWWICLGGLLNLYRQKHTTTLAVYAN